MAFAGGMSNADRWAPSLNPWKTKINVHFIWRCSLFFTVNTVFCIIKIGLWMLHGEAHT